MARAFCLLAVLFGLYCLMGCRSRQASTSTIEMAPDELSVSTIDIDALPPAPTDPAVEELGLMELDVELEIQESTIVAELSTIEVTEMTEQVAPRNDLMSSVGQFSGTGIAGRGEAARGALVRVAGGNFASDSMHHGLPPGATGDRFSPLGENEFRGVKDAPLSTFSIDVDTASYSKVRSYLLEHRSLPSRDAVRIEELINYFDYDYEGPTDDKPFAVHLETAECPWQPQHRLVRCGLQGKQVAGERPVSNLVFLIDVSGSMAPTNKLPLVQRTLGMLVGQLGENDRVSMVVYAGAAGLVLPPTNGAERAKILAAVQSLQAGGSTNGGQGIQLAYKLAQENLIKAGVNRVILCTDGDFNVGVTGTDELVKLAAEQAQSGIYLSVLGFGIGNHNDAMLEQLSNKANGNYAFIDTDLEARKVFVQQLEGTLITIAKDVKIQVEFNPAQVAAYRLIGYENRQLANRDFNDDKKDAGDIGAGHRVTALYEIIPAGADSEFNKPAVDPLKYQGVREEPPPQLELTAAAQSGELLTLKLRYQPPAGGASTLVSFPVKDSNHRFAAASKEFQFAAAVAAFGMLLRDSKHKGTATYAAVAEIAQAARGADKHGLRNEFLQIVTAAQSLSPAGMMK